MSMQGKRRIRALHLLQAGGPVEEAWDSVLQPELCYRALASRDTRFDGRFYVAVLTTGVYCRPICPARTPKLQNVRFYPCAAAAQADGFRPCLRCRPETSPGTPAWVGTSATVSRALRFIAGGALAEGSVEDLATRLGIGERQLRRLFLKHLGASPTAVAQTQRLHFAKQLLDETDLPMAQIAFDAGFLSLRRFNAAMKRAFHGTPTQLRTAGRSRTHGNGGELVLRLPFRPPLDWDRIVNFLRARAIPGVESVHRRSYRRVVRMDDAVGILEVTPSDGRPFLLLRLPNELAKGVVTIIERTRRLFDLGAVPSEIAAHLSGDPALASRIENCPGLRVPGAWDGFELAIRAILGQQVTVRGATTLIGRLVADFGERVLDDSDSDLTHTFPSPEVLASAPVERIGLPRARAASIRALAAAVIEGRLSLRESVSLEESVARLTDIPGIGPWTAHYIAMRALGEPDAFPTGDLGLRRVLSNGRLISTTALAERAEQWRPWRAYAAMALWTGDRVSGVVVGDLGSVPRRSPGPAARPLSALLSEEE